eukprot:CAMPEP_0195045072 /NCGR_PEP_ID=MMETSP0347-20130606/12902_1 /TAXON_ID=2932 /ORGANISM="Alexandrium fundyense, Strain CCMP1719" /LENGTH=30 /DNA_ID= /DNA_START= /DNA_END= /DNA_ORIENTATION=
MPSRGKSRRSHQDAALLPHAAPRLRGGALR